MVVDCREYRAHRAQGKVGVERSGCRAQRVHNGCESQRVQSGVGVERSGVHLYPLCRRARSTQSQPGQKAAAGDVKGCALN